ncbi:MAG: hypothetical protein NUV67_01505 [archaeon]|nr:hypothetical protein [archaeon]
MRTLRELQSKGGLGAKSKIEIDEIERSSETHMQLINDTLKQSALPTPIRNYLDFNLEVLNEMQNDIKRMRNLGGAAK